MQNIEEEENVVNLINQMQKIEQLKSIMGDLKYQASVDSSIDEMKSDNRLGGSKSAYSKNYK